jgi:O-antigen/teichoic acid export membrane protein
MNYEAEVLAAPGWSAGLGKRIAKNTAWLLAGRLAAQGMAMLFTILIARRLGEAGLGQYAFVTSVLFVGNLTPTFGTDMLIMREVAGKRDLRVVPASLALQLGLSVFFIGLTFAFAALLPSEGSQEATALQIR